MLSEPSRLRPRPSDPSGAAFGLQIIKAVIDAGASIKVLDRSYIDLTTPMGRGCMAMMSAMAEDERLRIISRTHEGRQIAQAKGVRMGRKPKLTPHQMRKARCGEAMQDIGGVATPASAPAQPAAPPRIAAAVQSSRRSSVRSSCVRP